MFSISETDLLYMDILHRFGLKGQRKEAPSPQWGLLRNLLVTALITIPSIQLQAEHSRSDNRARYGNTAPAVIGTRDILTFTPVSLQGGSRVTVIAPKEWQDIGESLKDSLRETHDRYTRLLGTLPPVNTAVRLMDTASFTERTGAPSWTNAMFYRGEVMIPLARGTRIDLQELKRAVRHEYTHAIIHELSDGKCPGWLDEGIAQWAEGDENPALQPALYRWLQKHSPVPLHLLQGGFTRLEKEMVPAAYAQSLFASNIVLTHYGFNKLRTYLDYLRAGDSSEDAFAQSFGESTRVFESKMSNMLADWRSKRARRH